MDLSQLAAPDVGAFDRDFSETSGFATGSAAFKQASQSIRSAAAAVSLFARSTADFGGNLNRASQQTQQAYGGGGAASSAAQIGGVAKLFGSGLSALTGVDLGGPISMGMQIFGLASSLFGKKPTVGPGGGADFGVDATGKAKLGVTSADNGYDPSVNQSAADTVGAGMKAWFDKLGLAFKGTNVADAGSNLGYDAGKKQYTGGDTTDGKGRYNTLDEAMAAALAASIKNADLSGVSAALADKIRAVDTPRDLDQLSQYILGLKALTDGFAVWQAPLNQAQVAVNALDASYKGATDAATVLGRATDDLKSSYDKQKNFLVTEFNRPLEERYLRATNQNAAADEMVRAKAESDLRAQAAALGGDAVVQAEKTIQAERLAIVQKAVDQQKAAAEAQAQASAAAMAGILNSISAGLDQALAAWRGVAETVRKFTDQLGLSAASPLSPEAQLSLARKQYQDLLGRAMGGDATAAQGVTASAQTLLDKGRGYYASSSGYADLYNQVQAQLGGLANYAGSDAQSQAQQRAAESIRALRGFDKGGVTNPGEMVRVHPGELLYTGPQTRVFNPFETRQLLGGGNDNRPSDAAIQKLTSLIETLIRITAASGQMNAETQAQMAETLDAIRRKANLQAAA